MAKTVYTVTQMVQMILSKHVDGLEFFALMKECSYIGHQEAFETNIRSMVRHNKIFPWKGRYHHIKYRGEQVKVKRIETNKKQKKEVNTLKKVVRKININFDMKIIVLNELADIVSNEKRLVLRRVISDLKTVSNASL